MSEGVGGFFFWLGADGELEELSLEEFEQKQRDTRADRDRWINVEIEDNDSQ